MESVESEGFPSHSKLAFTGDEHSDSLLLLLPSRLALGFVRTFTKLSPISSALLYIRGLNKLLRLTKNN